MHKKKKNAVFIPVSSNISSVYPPPPLILYPLFSPILIQESVFFWRTNCEKGCEVNVNES